MTDWTDKPLGQLARFQKGRKVRTSDFAEDGFATYLGAASLAGESEGYAATGLAVLAASTDVLMLWDGERSGLVGHGLSGVVSSTVSRLTPTTEITGTYLYYHLAYRYEWIQGRRTGTGVPHVPKDLARILKIGFPIRFPEQQRITEVLLAVDSAIEKTEALIAKYQRIKAGQMHDLFTRGVTADGKLRPPREQAPELYQETPIGWILKEWTVSGLREKALSGRPHLRTGPFGSSLKGEHWVDDGHPVITIGALGEGRFIESELLFVGDADAKRLKEFHLQPGDVVFSRVADVGRSIVIRADQAGWIMSSNLMRISLDRSEVLPEYLQQQLAFDVRLKRQIRAKVNSGGRDVANSDILNRLLFAWPTFEEQQRIIERASTTDSKLEAEEGTLEKLKEEKLGLMHDLLTGKVRVPLDTPAQVPAHV